MIDSRSAALELRRVSFAYAGRIALEEVSFHVRTGVFAALLGPNGSGKSTCLRLLLGLLKPNAGEVATFGGTPGRRGDLVGYVPQSVTIPRGFPISAGDVALMGRYGRIGPGRRPTGRDRHRARAALAQVGMADHERRRFQELSGGQQRRVLIARALAGDPRLLLLDEPTAVLDSAARARFYNLVCDLQHEHSLTLLCATHDLDVVGNHADQLVLLDRTVRAEGRPHDVLTDAVLRSVYGFPTPHVHDRSPPAGPPSS